MKIKQFLKFASLAFLAAIPVIAAPLIITSCSSSEEPVPPESTPPTPPNQEPQPPQSENPDSPSFPPAFTERTDLISDKILANSLNFADKTPEEAIKLIDEQFIFDNKDKFFKGGLQAIDNIEDITYFQKGITFKENERKIIINFYLAQGSWYNDIGMGWDNKKCSFEISGFANASEDLPPIYTPTKIKKEIEAKELGLDFLTAEKFYTNLKISGNLSSFLQNFFQVLFTGNLITDFNFMDSRIDLDQANNFVTIRIVLSRGWYDESGIREEPKAFTTSITNFRDPSTPEPVYTPPEKTLRNQRVLASDLDLSDKTPEEAIKLIDNNFIAKYKEKLFSGSTRLIKPDSIFNLYHTRISDSVIKIHFVLKPKTYFNYEKKIDFFYALPNEIFIVNLKDTTPHQKTTVKTTVEAKPFYFHRHTSEQVVANVTPKTLLKYLHLFLEGDNIVNNWKEIEIDEKTKISNTEVVFKIRLAPNTWYDENGNLGSDYLPLEFKMINLNDGSDPKIPIIPSLFEETRCFNAIDAKELGLENKTVSEVKNGNLINQKMIYDNRYSILYGSFNLTNQHQITNIEITIPKNNRDNRVIVNFNLIKNTCYDFENKIIEHPKTFTIAVKNLKAVK